MVCSVPDGIPWLESLWRVGIKRAYGGNVHGDPHNMTTLPGNEWTGSEGMEKTCAGYYRYTCNTRSEVAV